MGDSMIERYGRARVRRIVAEFYEDLLTSPRLHQFFENVDIAGLAAHQTAFLQAVMGGPQSHTRPQIREAHRDLGIGSDDFDEMIRLLDESLQRHGVSTSDRETIELRYRSYLPEVVEPEAT